MTSAKQKLIISADVSPHPVLEHDIIERGRAREDMGIGMEQRGTGYRDVRTQARRNPGQR